MKLGLLVVLLIGVIGSAFGTVYYSRQTGNWNANATWSTVTYGGASAGAFPVAGDDVNIGGGNFTITVNVNSACGTLSYQSGTTNSPIVSLNAGITLNVAGAITIPRAGNPNVNTLAVGAGTLNAASMAFTNGGGGQRHVLTISTGTVTITGSITQTGSTGSATITFTGAGLLQVAGTFLDSNTGTLTASTGTVEFNGAVQTVGDFNYNNLTLSGSGAKDMSGLVSTIGGNFVMSGTSSVIATSGLTITGSVTLGAGNSFTAGALTHNVAGNWTNNGATFTATGSTINLNGAAQSIGGSNSTTFNNLALATGGSTKTLSIATFIGGNLSIANTVIVNPGAIATHTAKTLIALNSGQISGTWGSTASSATNKFNTIFTAGTTGIVTVSNNIYYSRQTGNWNANATWSTVTYGNATNTGTFPVAGDDVNIGGGNFTITVNVNSACGTLSYQSGTNNSPIVSLNAGITLNVAGAITIPRATNPDVNTLAVGAGTLNAASMAFTNGGGGQRHVLTISTGTVTVTGSITQSGSTGSATISFTGAGLLKVGGAFLNSGTGTLTQSTGTVEYNGTVAQTAGDFTYYNLRFNNTFGTAPQVTISNAGSAVIVQNLLTMTSGVVNLNGQSLTIGTAAGSPGSLSHGGTSASGWLYGGSLVRYFSTGAIASRTTTGLFPVGGDAVDFRPLYLGASGITTGGTLTVSHTSIATTSSANFPDGGNTVKIHGDSYWSLTNTSIAGGNYDLSAEGTGFGTVGVETDLRITLSGSVVGSDGAHPTPHLVNIQVNRNTLTATDITNSFFIGSINNVNSPLPVELSNFAGFVEKDHVELLWETKSELRNDYFTVLRSSTGTNFQPIGTAKGYGTTATTSTYYLIDHKPDIGKNYYQLKQTDFDGRSSYSKVILVKVEFPGSVAWSLYPNPTNGSEFIVSFTSFDLGKNAFIKVQDMGGKEIFQITTSNLNSKEVKVITPQTLLPGLYIISIGIDQQVIRQKLIVTQ